VIDPKAHALVMFDYNIPAKVYWTVAALLGLVVPVLSCAALGPLGRVAAAQVGLGAILFI
jgi:uncharacterized membrane protein YraQ (UPF0718 family)